MVEISKSGSGEGLGGVIPRGYSKMRRWLAKRLPPPAGSHAAMAGDNYT